MIMKLKKLYEDGHKTITFEYIDGEELPDEGTVVYPEGGTDNGVRVGKVLYDKFNIIVFEVIDFAIEGSYEDFD